MRVTFIWKKLTCSSSNIVYWRSQYLCGWQVSILYQIYNETWGLLADELPNNTISRQLTDVGLHYFHWGIPRDYTSSFPIASNSFHSLSSHYSVLFRPKPLLWCMDCTRSSAHNPLNWNGFLQIFKLNVMQNVFCNPFAKCPLKKIRVDFNLI